jgi:hypothetical protein
MFFSHANSNVRREPMLTNHYQTPSGRFRRGGRSSQKIENTDRLKDQSQAREVDIGRLCYVFLLFVQGALCGMCIQTLHSIVIGDSITSWDSSRFYFIGINLALTGSLCMIDKRKDSVGPKHLDASCVLVAVYFVALILSLSSSVIKACAFDDSSYLKTEGLETARSIFGIAGWLVSSFQIYQMVRDGVNLKD